MNSRPRRLAVFAAVAVAVLVLDVVSKLLVVAKLPPTHNPVRLLGGAIYLDQTRNAGAAFSLGTGFTAVLTAVAVVVVVVIVRAAARMRSTAWAVALGLVLGGAVGNLADRIFREPGIGRGHVVDWISLFGPLGQHFAIINLADSGITCGAILAAILALLGIDLDGLDGLRLDVALSRLLGMSRTAAANLIDDGGVSVDGTAAARSHTVQGGALLEVSMPEPDTGPPAPPQAVEGLVVLYDDADLLVVDKPIGVAAHPSPGWSGPTVTQGLAATGYQLAQGGPAERQGIVHRLDAGTTGVMVVAKSERAYSALKRAFKDRTVDKLYSALVQGHPDPTRGTIDAPIDRHPSSDYKFAVVAGGRASVTHYETVEAFRAATLLDVHLETGRTHQIRVHMAAVRHPCVGDLTYGADPVLARRLGLTRQWLHARELGFEHPGTGEQLRVSSPFPADLQHALDVLEREG